MLFPTWLERIDKLIFVLINHDSDHSFWDPVMRTIRDPYTWVPLYVFILFFALIKAKHNVWLFIVLSLLTFAVTDSITSSVLKPLFSRLRPCGEPSLAFMVRDLVGCGGSYSFPSSHAANHFGLAMLWYSAVLTMTGKKWKWLFPWAAIICYAQIYVGKHYPLDVIAGGLFGSVVGLCSAKAFYWIWKKMTSHHPILMTPSPSGESIAI